ncbi:uncharacterized protein TNIN_243551 [Trichonephila inaurata madagascariensis]|uniref:Uncharacterized protein n=1 Tax=Trichonephila inaurata madagascariensis TaxID=2747483 RepID=A0A8X6YN97_9ARAC|nr:uncharacterized protein TNIN_243551 [Trichonephila inaurata madagascariensis]
MSRDLIFRRFMQKLFSQPSVDALELHQNNRRPKEYFTKNLLDLLQQVFAVLEIVIRDAWSEFVDVHFKLMASSPRNYIRHIIIMCSAEMERYTDIYDRFLIMLSVVIFTAEMMFDVTRKPFNKLNPQILTVFFEDVLREDFYRRGGWNRLEKHILSRKYTEYYKECLPYEFDIHNIPEDLKQRIRDCFSPELIWCKVGRHKTRFSNLTHKVMSSVDTSLLNILSSPKVNTEQSVSKEVVGSDPRTAKMDDSHAMEPEESDLYVRCKSKIDELERRLQNLVTIFELLDTK